MIDNNDPIKPMDSETLKATQKFNERMSHFDEEYDLEDEDRQLLANKLKSLDDSGFDAFKSEFAIFAKAKNKKWKAAQKEKMSKEEMDKKHDENCASKDKKEVKASEALDDVKEKKDENKPTNTVEGAEGDKEKFKDAFSIEKGFTLNFNKR